jgi:phage terminase small subunit
MPKRSDGLTARERCFVQEYLVDLNASQASIRAGYSKNSASQLAYTLTKRPRVAAAIRAAMDARAKRTQITADRVLREFARIAFADIRSFTEPGQESLTVKSLDALSADDAAAIAEVRRSSDGKDLKVKLHDKKKALDSIARHLGLFGKHASAAESPAAAAQRAREFILGRLAQGSGSKDSG